MVQLTPAARKFIVHFGKMGARWGVNRTVAQIHALLYLSPRPLNAEEISESLSVARSTVSTGLHELQGWNLVKLVQVLGDRRDHFEALSDAWEMMRTIVDERKRRELDPTLEMLREVTAELGEGSEEEAYARDKLLEMLDCYETAAAFYEQLEKLPTEALVRIAKMGNLARKLLGSSAGA